LGDGLEKIELIAYNTESLRDLTPQVTLGWTCGKNEKL